VHLIEPRLVVRESTAFSPATASGTGPLPPV
jgi:hypothetical protein